MPVLVEQLLAATDLGLEVVGGHAGIGSRGPIRWAHISEIPDPTPWLEGGEILLTTGLGVKDSPDLQRGLIAGLDGRGCPAVGFGIGIWLDEVPPAMVAEADRRSLPLFTVPYEVPFIAVTKYVSRRVFEAHYRGLQRALHLHRRMLAAVTSGGGLQEILRVTAQSIGGVEALLLDAFGRVQARAAHGVDPIDAEDVRRVLTPTRGHRGSARLDGRVITATPVRARSDDEGLLVVVSATELDEAQQLLVEQAVTATGVELSRGGSLRAQRRSAVADLLDDALQRRSGRAQLAARFAALDLDPAAPYRLLALPSVAPLSDATLCRLVEDAAGGHRVAAGVVGDTVHAIVQPADAAIGPAVLAAARASRLPRLRLGRSHRHDGVEGLATAMRESRAAARRSSGSVVDVADLGVAAVLAGLGGDGAPATFVTTMLGPLLDRDDPALLDTLRAYLRHGCRPGPAATELQIHRHTLAYRLARIAQLTGRDPRAGEHLVSYGLALELLGGPGDASPVAGAAGTA